MMIGTRAAHGVAWLMAQTLIGRAIALLSQLVLAKLLMPDDFGILGLATTVSAVFSLLINVGVDEVLQQRAARMRYWATQAFWISLTLSSLAAVVMAVYAPIGAKLYGNEKIAGLIWVVALAFPFQAAVILPQVKLRARLRFKFLASYNTLEAFLTQALTVLMAWLGCGALSFVVPITLLAMAKAVIFWYLAPLALRPWKRSKGWLRLGVKSAANLGSQICVTLIQQGGYIVLGLLAPTAVVGAYYFAFRLAVQPMALFAGNFTNVLFPTLVALNGEPQRQRDIAFKTAYFLGLLTTPLCLALAAIAEPLMTFLFGDRWSGSVFYIQVLSLGLPLDALSWPTGSLMLVRGLFLRKTVYLMVSVAFFFVLVGSGGLLGSARGVAIAVSIYYVVHPVALNALVFMKEGIAARKIVLSFAIPYALSLLSLGGAYLLAQTPLLRGHPVAQMVVTLGVGSLAYVGAVRLFLPAFYEEIRARLRVALGRTV